MARLGAPSASSAAAELGVPMSVVLATAVALVIDAPDLFKVLGVARDASVADVQQAHRRLSLLIHPDKNGNPRAEQATVRVNEARATLIDVRLRAAYAFAHPPPARPRANMHRKRAAADDQPLKDFCAAAPQRRRAASSQPAPCAQPPAPPDPSCAACCGKHRAHTCAAKRAEATSPCTHYICNQCGRKFLSTGTARKHAGKSHPEWLSALPVGQPSLYCTALYPTKDAPPNEAPVADAPPTPPAPADSQQAPSEVEVSPAAAAQEGVRAKTRMPPPPPPPPPPRVPPPPPPSTGQAAKEAATAKSAARGAEAAMQVRAAKEASAAKRAEREAAIAQEEAAAKEEAATNKAAKETAKQARKLAAAVAAAAVATALEAVGASEEGGPAKRKPGRPIGSGKRKRGRPPHVG